MTDIRSFLMQKGHTTGVVPNSRKQVEILTYYYSLLKYVQHINKKKMADYKYPHQYLRNIKASPILLQRLSTVL